MAIPQFIKDIPAQMVNERASFGPFDLKELVNLQEGVQFSAALSNGESLPKGLICTSDGVITGIPAKDSQGNYEVVVTVSNQEGSTNANFIFTIKPNLAEDGDLDYLDKLKAQVWDALDKNLPPPDIQDLMNRAITPVEFYYLLERWGTLSIYDAFNLEAPGEKTLLTLEGASKEYNVYDRGSCIVMAPKELFSSTRTLEDGLQTARAIAREVYKREWTIEFVGFDKFSRSAWVELQHLSDKFGRRADIINYITTTNDLNIYSLQMIEQNRDQQLDSEM